jgi:hypothetical protein
VITVQRLRELIADLPDDAMVSAYEGEGIGIGIEHETSGKHWWIDAAPFDEDTHIEGFDQP